MTRSNKHKPGKAKPATQSPQTATAAMDEPDASLLVLHVIRILALYIYVLLSRFQPISTSLDDFFFPETKPIELLESSASSIEQQVNAALLACVQGEIASNQFDGLIQEKTVFAAIKRVFRQQKVEAATQCRLLVRLLNSYLTQLAHEPIVRCESMGMLASTLEYLARGPPDQSKNEPVATSLLYPLVNAIDSLSIEQRECLDALTTLWRWLEACDPSKLLLDRIISIHHSVIFYMEPSAKASSTSSASSSLELGTCFVRTLVHHADHIFRHDLDFSDPDDLLSSDSDTDIDESSQLLLPCEEPSTPPPKRSTPHSISPSKTPKHSPEPIVKESDDARQDAEPVVIDANEPVPANMMRVGIAAAAGTLAAALCVIFT